MIDGGRRVNADLLLHKIHRCDYEKSVHAGDAENPPGIVHCVFHLDVAYVQTNRFGGLTPQ